MSEMRKPEVLIVRDDYRLVRMPDDGMILEVRELDAMQERSWRPRETWVNTIGPPTITKMLLWALLERRAWEQQRADFHGGRHETEARID